MGIREENEELRMAVVEAREKIADMSEWINAVCQPPLIYARVVGLNGSTVDVALDSGQKQAVSCPRGIKRYLRPGDQVHLSPKSFAIVAKADPASPSGLSATIDKVLPDSTAIVTMGGIEKVISTGVTEVKPGDSVIVDPSCSIVLSKYAEGTVSSFGLETVPQVEWSSIGGLASTKQQIQDIIMLPIANREAFQRYRIRVPKGVLLYGPPGCGKTLLAKAVAYNLSKGNGNGKGHFLSIKGPQILDKYVGNSEKYIRELFTKARELASESGYTTVIFIDEAESIFKKRGSSISSDIHDTIVPQFLSEMDGIDSTNNVLLVLASNRADIIDDAVLRPGRIDSKIYVERPGRDASLDIMMLYLGDCPIDLAGSRKMPEKVAREMAKEAVAYFFDEGRKLYEVLIGGMARHLPLCSIASGAMLENIANRAKFAACKREIAGGRPGISGKDLFTAIDVERDESAGLVNLLTMEDLAKYFGDQAQHVTAVRPYKEQ